MLLMWEGSHGYQIKLPWYTSDHAGNLSKSGTISFDGVKFANVVVDGKLKGAAFKMAAWPSQFFDLRPDVTIFDCDGDKSVTFIEVKTIGASAARNISLYEDLVKFLRHNGWASGIYYLLSEGHEKRSDWRMLCENKSRILKWEDVIRRTINTPFAKIFDLDLSEYTGEG